MTRTMPAKKPDTAITISAPFYRFEALRTRGTTLPFVVTTAGLYHFGEKDDARGICSSTNVLRAWTCTTSCKGWNLQARHGFGIVLSALLLRNTSRQQAMTRVYQR